ncbi:hypothetical protein BYT27DRAFT_7324086 [Phlegmacium glaucopus]|nr:hypothetical protein BYT27DRAFT_7324086 [Phlegmacium glaucopus]
MILWGWPDFEFSVDNNPSKYLNINIDLVVAMPCGYLSVDLRDAMGDRLSLSGGFRRNGVLFDVGTLDLQGKQSLGSRNSRGLFDWLLWREKPLFKPIYNYEPAESACRISGTLAVKRVRVPNLHITSLGHGYASFSHVDHKHIVQPLDDSFEATDKILPTHCPNHLHCPRTNPLRANQYSVTYYKREVPRNPRNFFQIWTRPSVYHTTSTTFLHLLIRVVGVLGGVFICMGYTNRITTCAVEVVSGADQAPSGIVAVESSGVKVGLRVKWGGSELRARPRSGKLVPQGSGWVTEGGNTSPYSSHNNTTLLLTGFPSPGIPSPYINSATSAPSTPNPATPGSVGLGYPSGSFGPISSPGGILASASLGPPPRTPRSTSAGSVHSPLSPGPTQTLLPSDPNDPGVVLDMPSSASHSEYPASANPSNRNGFQMTLLPPPKKVVPGKDD